MDWMWRFPTLKTTPIPLFFAFLCLITTITRILSGYIILKEVAKNKEKMVFKQNKDIGNNS